MQLRELEKHLDIDIDGSLADRFMDNEALYMRFLRKLLDSQDFELLEQALAAKDYEELLRRAHNLKGVCANLGLNGLSTSFALLVQKLRNGCKEQAALESIVAQLRVEWSKALQCIGELC